MEPTKQREVCYQQTKQKYVSCMSSGIRDGITGLGVFHAVFKSCYSPVFPNYDLIAPFKNGYAYLVPLCIGSK